MATLIYYKPFNIGNEIIIRTILIMSDSTPYTVDNALLQTVPSV